MADTAIGVLHVLDGGAAGPGVMRLVAELQSSLDGVRQDVLLLGAERRGGWANGCGLEISGRIPMSRFTVTMTGKALRAWIARREASGEGYDIIHAWSASTGLILRRSTSRSMLLTITSRPRNDRDVRKLQALLHAENVSCMSLSRSLVDMLNLENLITVIHPGISSPVPLERLRDQCRRRWGVGKTTFVIGLLGVPISQPDARYAVAALHRLRATGRDMILVLPEEIEQRAEVERFARRVNCRDELIFDPAMAQPWTNAVGLDTALGVMERSGSDSTSPVLPMLWAVAAGVPVFIQESPEAREYLADATETMFMPRDDPNAVWEHVIRLYDDRDLGGQVAGQLRTLANERFDPDRFRTEIGGLYQRIASRKIRA